MPVRRRRRKKREVEGENEEESLVPLNIKVPRWLKVGLEDMVNNRQGPSVSAIASECLNRD